MKYRDERTEPGYREQEQYESRRIWPTEEAERGSRYAREQAAEQQPGYGGERTYGGERGYYDEPGYGEYRERAGYFGGYGGYGRGYGGYGMGRGSEYGGYHGRYGMGRRRGWGMGRGYEGSEAYEGRAYQRGEPEEWRAPGIERPGGERAWRMGDVYGGGYGGGYGLYGREGVRAGERRGYRGRGPRNYVRSDERIREEVCDLLCVSDEVDASDLEVTVEEGEVRLTGRVDDRDEKYLAEDLAASVTGVRDVTNQIRVQRGSATIEGRSEQSRTATRTEEGEGRGTAATGETIRTTTP